MKANMKSSRFVGYITASVPVVVNSSMPHHSEQLNVHPKTPEEQSTETCMGMRW